MADDPTPDPTPTPEPKPTEATVQLTTAEVDALRRQAREGREAQRRVERERKEADETRAAEQGEWQKLAEQAQEQRDDAIQQAERVQREALTARVASRMDFHDSADALWRLRDDELDGEEAVRRGLERIAREAPHLVRAEKRVPEIGQVHAPEAAQAADARPPLDVEQIKRMAPQEVIERQDEIEKFLRTQYSPG